MHADLRSFLDHLVATHKSPLTVRRYGDVLRDLEEFTNGAQPAALTTELLRRFASAPCGRGQPRAPAGVNLRVAVVRALFAYLTLERGYSSNPALRVVGVPERRRTPKHLTSIEVDRLVEHVAREGGALAARDLALVVVFWQTALRVAEVARLRLDQLDREGKLLRSVTVKGGHQLDVALNDETLVVIRKYLEMRGELPGNAPLFATREGGQLSVRAIQARFENWRRELGWTRALHPHVLRHTHATQALAAGVDIATVADLLRHADLRTVMVYAKVQDTTRRAALMKLGALIPPSVLPAAISVELSTAGLPAPVSPSNDVGPADFPCVEGGFDAECRTGTGG
jgi:integrase/recombinase XerC